MGSYSAGNHVLEEQSLLNDVEIISALVPGICEP